MQYRMIALDIDGTIRSRDYPLSDRTRRAIARVEDTGAVVTLATGRVFRTAVSSTAELNLRSPIASFQGAQVTDPVTEEVLWHRPLTRDMVHMALDALAPWDVAVMGYLGDQVYFSRLTPWAEGYRSRNKLDANVVADLRELASCDLSRLVVVGEPDQIPQVATALQARFDSQLYVTRSLPEFCEILHPEGGKDKALEWLCGYLGIRRDETIAFGNGYNDVPMIRWAGLGVAVGGAVSDVLEVADEVVPPIEEDGVAQFLEGLLDQGLIG